MSDIIGPCQPPKLSSKPSIKSSTKKAVAKVDTKILDDIQDPAFVDLPDPADTRPNNVMVRCIGSKGCKTMWAGIRRDRNDEHHEVLENHDPEDNLKWLDDDLPASMSTKSSMHFGLEEDFRLTQFTDILADSEGLLATTLKSSGEILKPVEKGKRSDKDEAISVAPTAKDWEDWSLT